MLILNRSKLGLSTSTLRQLLRLENSFKSISLHGLSFMINERLKNIIASSTLEPLDYLLDLNYLNTINEGGFPKWLKLVSEMPLIETSFLTLAKRLKLALLVMRQKLLFQLSKSSFDNLFRGEKVPLIYSESRLIPNGEASLSGNG